MTIGLPTTAVSLIMLGIYGQGMSAGQTKVSTTTPVLVMLSTPSAARVTIENLSSGTIARVGFAARGDAGNIGITVYGTGNTGTLVGLPVSNLAELAIGSAAAFLIRTAALSTPMVVATNTVERFRADSGGVSVASNLTVGSSLYVRSSALFSGNLVVTDSAVFSSTTIFTSLAIFSGGTSMTSLTIASSFAVASPSSVSTASSVNVANIVPTSAARFMVVTVSGTKYGLALYEISA